MAEQEAEHRAKFDALLAQRGVRPTALQPFWDVAGFALGAATALIGPKAAMACTAAVETEIDRHYTEQLEELGDSDPELSAMIEQFREDERAHRDARFCRRGRAGPGLSAAVRGNPAGLPGGDPAGRTDLICRQN
jgi:3-demethoxyubiquinol 3-hydroxylase